MRDRDTLSAALDEYQAGTMAHIDEAERASVVDHLKQRLAELDLRIAQLGQS